MYSSLIEVMNTSEFRELFMKLPTRGEKNVIARLRMKTDPEAVLEGIIDATECLPCKVSEEFVDLINYLIEADVVEYVEMPDDE